MNENGQIKIAQARLTECTVNKSQKTGNDYAFARFASLEFGDIRVFLDVALARSLQAQQGQTGALVLSLRFDRGEARVGLVSFGPGAARASA